MAQFKPATISETQCVDASGGSPTNTFTYSVSNDIWMGETPSGTKL